MGFILEEENHYEKVYENVTFNGRVVDNNRGGYRQLTLPYWRK